MTVLLGSATFHEANDKFQIQPPTGFNTSNMVRITNYTVDVLILQNIAGNNQSDTQYLMPFTQMVYPINTTQDYPKMAGLQLGTDLPTELILVEWSDDGENDFIGTYPVSQTIAPSSALSVSTEEGTVTLSDSGTGSIPKSLTRITTTAINYGPDIVYFGASAPDTSFPYVPVGGSITYDNGSKMFLLAGATGAEVGYFGESSA